MLKYPETCMLCATWLLVSGNSVAGYILLSLSMLFCFARFAIKNQEETEKQKKSSENIESITTAISNAAFGLGLLDGYHSKRKNEVSH